MSNFDQNRVILKVTTWLWNVIFWPKCIRKQIWPGRKICPGQPRIIIWTNLRSSAFWFWRFLKGFYHIWAWRPSWSCDQDHLNKLWFPHPKKSPYEIWVQLAQWSQRRCLKMLTDAFSSGELITSTNLMLCTAVRSWKWCQYLSTMVYHLSTHLQQWAISTYQNLLWHHLNLNALIATEVVCFSRLLKCLRSLYGKQCGPRSDCSYRSSLFWVHGVSFYT